MKRYQLYWTLTLLICAMWLIVPINGFSMAGDISGDGPKIAQGLHYTDKETKVDKVIPMELPPGYPDFTMPPFGAEGFMIAPNMDLWLFLESVDSKVVYALFLSENRDNPRIVGIVRYNEINEYWIFDESPTKPRKVDKERFKVEIKMELGQKIHL